MQVVKARFDVVVVGAGNAALSAALSAREQGASVLILERAPEDRRAGNAVFTGGVMRTTYAGMDDVIRLVPDLAPEEAAGYEVGKYTREDFLSEIASVTEYQTDGALAEVLADKSYETLTWLRDCGVRFTLNFGFAVKVPGGLLFRGSAPVAVVGGGLGMSNALFTAAFDRGVEIWYNARAIRLETNAVGVNAVVVRRNSLDLRVECRSVVLACGGFEASPSMRAQYLGPDWDLAKVRGSEYNTGDGIAMALAIGAQPYGHWSGCHATPTDANAPEFGDRGGRRFERHSYQFGVLVNRRGQRFVDEASDIELHTYSKLGREILRQPGRIAFQVFDAKVETLLRPEYRAGHATKVQANTLPELAAALEIDAEAFLRTVDEFNRAATDAHPFDPSLKDGKSTRGLTPPKSNWAQPIDTAPFLAFPVRCGITFTFGGLRIDTSGRVIDVDGKVIPGLFAAGELVGGLFYYGCPTGCGITAGAVFGRVAGKSAAQMLAHVAA